MLDICEGAVQIADDSCGQVCILQNVPFSLEVSLRELGDCHRRDVDCGRHVAKGVQYFHPCETDPPGGRKTLVPGTLPLDVCILVEPDLWITFHNASLWVEALCLLSVLEVLQN